MNTNISQKDDNIISVPNSTDAKNVRFHLLDAFRGVTMISMVLYHSCYDYFSAFGKNPGWIATKGAFLWQQSICISFILLSGMVWRFGRRHALKRGLILIALGSAITLITVAFMPSQAIHYGILTFMGIATLFMIPLDRLWNRNNTESNTIESPAGTPYNSKFGKNKPVLTELFHIVICLIIFAVTKHMPHGYIGTRYHILVHMPDALYKYAALAPLGFPAPGFGSADYFPVIPWIFMYLTGFHLGNILFDRDSFIKIGNKRIPFLSWLGTKSLLVYIIHQPVCFGIVWLICRH